MKETPDTRMRRSASQLRVLAIIASLSTALFAADSGDPPLGATADTGSVAVDETATAAPAGIAPTAVNQPAAGEAEGAWVDKMQKRFAGGVDGSARWFDGFFGETFYDDTSQKTYGRASLQVAGKEYEGLWTRGEFRARFPLPNLSHRVNAIVGRGDPDDIIEDNNDYGSLVPSGDDDEWLAGLGYTPPWSKSGRISLGAGVRLDWPLDPYVQARYKFVHDFSNESLMRLRVTTFWRNNEGYGVSSNLDLERRMGTSRLLRWANVLKVSEETDDLRYDSRVILYQSLDADRAFSVMIGMKGETGDPVKVREYGTLVTYRERMFREWFFGELLFGVFRLREDDWTERKTGLFFGVGMEFFFGEPPASSTSREARSMGATPTDAAP